MMNSQQEKEWRFHQEDQKQQQSSRETAQGNVPKAGDQAQASSNASQSSVAGVNSIDLAELETRVTAVAEGHWQAMEALAELVRRAKLLEELRHATKEYGKLPESARARLAG